MFNIVKVNNINVYVKILQIMKIIVDLYNIIVSVIKIHINVNLIKNIIVYVYKI
jgi:hypothetical protein